MINVVCAIITHDNKILVTQRSEKMKLPLKWEFPGGKIEENETDENCIRRELREELNIEITLKRRLKENTHNYGNFTVNLIPFLVEYISGKIILTEHKDSKWLEKEKLLDLDWAEADIPILKEFLSLNYV